MHANLPAHHLHQPLRHHQANAGALHGGCLLAKPVERLEQLGNLLGREPVAGVFHADADACRRHRPTSDIDGAARLVVFNGVGQQVEQHLLHARVVGLDSVSGLRRGKADAHATLLGHWPDQGLAFAQHTLQRGGLHGQ